MKVVAVMLLAFVSIECRRTVSLNKNDNVDFINMEGGGGVRPPLPSSTLAPKQPVPVTTKPVVVALPTTVPTKPAVIQVPVTPAPKAPVPQIPITPPPKAPAPIVTPRPEYPALPAKPLQNSTVPGGNVQQLVNYYNSQGQGSPIRPYTYSQAVKQG